MLLSSERLRPCSERCSRSSEPRATVVTPPSTLIVIRGSKVRFNSPFAPLTVTVAPSTLMSTPLGTVMGIFPIRDIDYLYAS